MKLILPDYNGPHRILSLAKRRETADDLETNQLDYIFLQDNELFLFPEGEVYPAECGLSQAMQSCADYSTFELFPDGTLLMVYDGNVDDFVFYITGSCNSNCIMCPSPTQSRKNCPAANIDTLIEIGRHVPQNIRHITVTGGEPFIVGKDIFRFLQFCKEKFTEAEFQVLTNGRIFAIDEYSQMLWETIPDNEMIGIPVHASSETLHDRISQTPGSFEQTIQGIRNLLKRSLQVEIRIVVNKWNLEDIERIADLVVNKMKNVHHVCIMAMEMTGNAHVNKDSIWVEYRESFPYIKPAILKLIKQGIDVVLYNFPLCTVEKEFWTICANSITPSKVRYDEVCDCCRVKDACGGVFAGTFRLERNALKPI